LPGEVGLEKRDKAHMLANCPTLEWGRPGLFGFQLLDEAGKRERGGA